MARWLVVPLVLIAVAVQAAPIHVGGGCSKPLAHVPAPDVAYQSGVDTNGWAVAPADLAPPPLANDALRHPRIELNQPLGNYLEDERYNLDATRPDLMLGTIEITPDGHTTLNGQRLDATNPTECGE